MPLEWFGDKFQRFADRIIEQRLHAAGQAMTRIAISLAPEETGLLKQSIYYTVMPRERLLTLHADTGYAWYQEVGTYKMRPHPYLRPAMAAAGPAFLSGIGAAHVQIQAGTYSPVGHIPAKILPHIRPHISAANRQYNRGIVAKMPGVAIHMNRQNESLRHRAPTGHTFVQRSRIPGLTRRKRAWN